MTVLGKILVFVILVLSLLWTFLTASTFAARTNWQAQAKKYQDEAKKAAEAATNMKTLLDAERETADERVRVARADTDRAENTTRQIQADRDTLFAAYQSLQASVQKVSAEQTPLLNRAERLTAEVQIKDEQIRAKDDELTKLKLSEQAAVVKANEQANIAKAKTDQANTLTDQVQALREAVEAAKRAGTAPRPGGVTAVRVPAPDQFRATVTRVDQTADGLLITINQGLDAGLQRNTELTLSRLSAGGQYLGKLVVFRVNPKDAVGRYERIPGVRQTPENLPKAGDTVTGGN